MNATEFAKLLREMPKIVKDMKHDDTLASAAAIVEKSVRQNFYRREGVDGHAWEPRKITVRPKQIKGQWFNHPLLILTGKLIGAATGGMGHVRTITAKKLQMGIDPEVVEYAAVHQYGGSSQLPNGVIIKIPSRSYFYLHKNERPKLRIMVKERTRQKLLKLIAARSRKGVRS